MPGRQRAPGPGGLCAAGNPPGPAVAEGWDDWGPFYSAMYMQHVGLDSSTVEMCADRRPAAGAPGRGPSRTWSSARRPSSRSATAPACSTTSSRLLRGENDAPRPACCPDPFDPQFHNWMQDYPQAYVIPLGAGQRSDAEANRLVDWLLFNDIEVSDLRATTP